MTPSHAVSRQPSAKRLRVKLLVEQLEDRTVPAVTLGTTITGMGFPDTQGYVPPDTIAAAGPDYLVEAVNTSIAVYSKSGGAAISLQTLGQFFASVSPYSDFSDPQVAFDESVDNGAGAAKGRFVVAALNFDSNTGASSLVFAVSNDADPRDGFTEMHKIDMGEGKGVFADFPRLGFNANAYVITTNAFTSITGFYSHVQVLAINKTQATDLSNATFTSFLTTRSSSHFTMTPAVMHGAAATDPMYFVEEGNSLFTSSLRVVKMTNVLSNTPSYVDTTIGVSSYGSPPTATQPGGGRIDAGDSRILSVAWRNNRLLATHTVGLKKADRVRWYEFSTNGTPKLTQTVTVPAGSGVNDYYPSLDINPNGDVGLTFMESSTSEYMSMYVSGQTAGSTAGSLQTPILAKAGQRHYSAFDGSPYRAGDFSGLTVDPQTGAFWAANEYATNATSNNWGTFIAKFSLAGLSTATSSGSGTSSGSSSGTKAATGPRSRSEEPANEVAAAVLVQATTEVPAPSLAPLAVRLVQLTVTGIPDVPAATVTVNTTRTAIASTIPDINPGLTRTARVLLNSGGDTRGEGTMAASPDTPPADEPSPDEPLPPASPTEDRLSPDPTPADGVAAWRESVDAVFAGSIALIIPPADELPERAPSVQEPPVIPGPESPSPLQAALAVVVLGSLAPSGRLTPAGGRRRGAMPRLRV